MAAEPRRSVFKRAVKDPALVGSGGPPPVTSSASLHAPEAARAKGVRASVFSRNTLTSTGLAALDSALGGGLALGTVACIIEDTPSECHALLLKHFLAQGLVHGHASALCSADDGLLRALPAAIPPSGGGADGEVKAKLASSRATLHAGMASRAGTETPADEHLKIAWRYKESLSNAGRQAAAPLSSVAADYCLRFDLSKAQDATAAAVQREGAANTAPGAVRHVALQQLDPRDHATPNGFAKVWQHVAELIDSTNASEDKVCRLALASVGTPMWWSMAQCSHGRGFVEDGRGSGAARARGLREAVRFMHSLKGKVRGSKCVAVVSIPHDVAVSLCDVSSCSQSHPPAPALADPSAPHAPGRGSGATPATHCGLHHPPRRAALVPQACA